jgi:hypothetical protein
VMVTGLPLTMIVFFTAGLATIVIFLAFCCTGTDLL